MVVTHSNDLGWVSMDSDIDLQREALRRKMQTIVKIGSSRPSGVWLPYQFVLHPISAKNNIKPTLIDIQIFKVMDEKA